MPSSSNKYKTCINLNRFCSKGPVQEAIVFLFLVGAGISVDVLLEDIYHTDNWLKESLIDSAIITAMAETMAISLRIFFHCRCSSKLPEKNQGFLGRLMFTELFSAGVTFASGIAVDAVAEKIIGHDNIDAQQSVIPSLLIGGVRGLSRFVGTVLFNKARKTCCDNNYRQDPESYGEEMEVSGGEEFQPINDNNRPSI